MNWQEVYKNIEDKLFVHFQCDVWERAAYYYLLAHSRIRGLETVIVPLSQITKSVGFSKTKSREVIRSLNDKGCIELEQTRRGHSVKVYLPGEMELPNNEEIERRG